MRPWLSPDCLGLADWLPPHSPSLGKSEAFMNTAKAKSTNLVAVPGTSMLECGTRALLSQHHHIKVTCHPFDDHLLLLRHRLEFRLATLSQPSSKDNNGISILNIAKLYLLASFPLLGPDQLHSA